MATRHGGPGGSTGRKLFCVSGAVAATGVYEVTFGVTLGELVSVDVARHLAYTAGRAISYSMLLIACGARPTPEIEGAERIDR